MSVLDYAVPSRPPSASPLRVIGAAIYLGISWTWCIGMFLPVLLIRDYGFWSWVIFALPNVLGAAFLGTALSADRSRHILSVHRSAISGFSTITAVFQIFFAVWIFHRVGLSVGFTVGVIVLSLLMGVVIRRDSIASYVLAGVVFLTSLAVWRFADRFGEMSSLVTVGEHLKVLESISFPLLYLSPTILFGFALCPYLDATFLKTRASFESDRIGRSIFAVGFGVVFLSMIVFTLQYAIVVWANLQSPGAEKSRSLQLIGIHWAVQIAITIAFHLKSITCVEASKRFRGTVIIVAAVSLGLSVGSLTFIGADGELLYRCFMGFYGLVFPAYVYLCMIPGRGKIKPTRRQIVITCIAILVALPMFWIGFIERHMAWLVPGVGVVLLAKMFDKRGPQEAVAETTTPVQQNSAPISN